ncbi:MAG: hypothetical protein OIN89_09930 [Candidatus Methanoperedens sp.]|jgi:hypothetical protein|nr:hypothetical protein [Candidatus Methanoperedens sp.]
MYDPYWFQEMYPEWFDQPVTTHDVLRLVFVFVVPFLIPYLYIKYFESRTVLYIRYKVRPFVKYGLHLEKVIIFLKRILAIRVFR